jgi:hypothetical protein
MQHVLHHVRLAGVATVTGGVEPLLTGAAAALAPVDADNGAGAGAACADAWLPVELARPDVGFALDAAVNASGVGVLLVVADGTRGTCGELLPVTVLHANCDQHVTRCTPHAHNAPAAAGWQALLLRLLVTRHTRNRSALHTHTSARAHTHTIVTQLSLCSRHRTCFADVNCRPTNETPHLQTQSHRSRLHRDANHTHPEQTKWSMWYLRFNAASR